VDRAKLLAWKWFLAKYPASSCTYHEWEMQSSFVGTGKVCGGGLPGVVGGLGGGHLAPPFRPGFLGSFFVLCFCRFSQVLLGGFVWFASPWGFFFSF